MDSKEWRRLNNKNHNMLIHGYLQCIQEYVLTFGLESTATYILKHSDICKNDLIRCQNENALEDEEMQAKMFEIIDNAFK